MFKPFAAIVGCGAFWAVEVGVGMPGAQAMTMDCVVADPNPPLNVRAAPRYAGQGPQKIVGTLPNNARVFPVSDAFGSEGDQWIQVAQVQNGEWKELGYVFRPMLNCTEVDTTHQYPLLIDSGSNLLRKFGLDHANTFPNRCFHYGDGGYTMSISTAFKARYDRIGMPFDHLCFVLRTGNMRYDPETGTRLPTYITGDLAKVQRVMRQKSGDLDIGDISEELPLQVPPCFRNARHQERSTLTSLGCTYRFHPWSGRRLSASEGAALAKMGLYIEGGAAPGTSAEAVKLALDARLRRSETQIEAEAQRLNR